MSFSSIISLLIIIYIGRLIYLEINNFFHNYKITFEKKPEIKLTGRKDFVKIKLKRKLKITRRG